MELSTLQVFVDVMRQGSFAAVARDRAVTPSTILRAICSLEDELCVRLFHRTTRRVVPTECARLYFERILPIVEELQSARQMVQDSSSPVGTLRIAAPVAWGQFCLVPLLPLLSARYPELSIALILDDTRSNQAAASVDVQIVISADEDVPNSAIRLGLVRYTACASPAYLANKTVNQPQDLEHCECLLTEEHQASWRASDQDGRVVEVSVQGRCVISSSLALLQCAVAGMGVALLPACVALREISSGALVSVLPDYEIAPAGPVLTASMQFPPAAYVPANARVFAEFFRDNLANQGSLRAAKKT